MPDVAIPEHREPRKIGSSSDFCPDNHILIDRDLYSHMQLIVREHHRVMPAIIIYEALVLGLIKATDSLANYGRVDEYVKSTETVQFYRLFNEYIERNPDKGFNFKFPVDETNPPELPPIF